MEAKLATVYGKERIEILNQLGVYYLEKNPKKTLNYGEKVLELSKTINYPEGRGNGLLNMAKASIYLSRRDEGLDLLAEALRIFQRQKSLEGIVNVNLVVAYINFLNGDNEEALKYYSEAYKLCNKLTENYNELKSIYLHSGIIYHRLRDNKRAISYFKKGLQMAEQAKHKKDIANFYERLGDIYSKVGKQKQALAYFQKALRLFKELGVPEKMDMQKINLASILRDDRRALEYLEEVLEHSKKIKNKSLYIKALIKMASRYNQMKNYKLAEQYYQKILKLGLPTNDFVLYKDISDLYDAMEDYKNALVYYKKYTKIKDKMTNIQKNNQLRMLQAKFERAKIESKHEILKLEKRYQLLIYISGSLLIFILLILFLRKKLPLFLRKKSNN
jgi:tetratricopeptide (TPR) repeat protein